MPPACQPLPGVILVRPEDELAWGRKEPLPREPGEALRLIYEQDVFLFLELFPGDAWVWFVLSKVEPGRRGVARVDGAHRGALSSPTLAHELKRHGASCAEPRTQLLDVW